MSGFSHFTASGVILYWHNYIPAALGLMSFVTLLIFLNFQAETLVYLIFHKYDSNFQGCILPSCDISSI